MTDQADTLRRLMRQRTRIDDENPQDPPERGVPVITVASGKGGVGKSCLVANLGAALARQGNRVLLVDGDMGLANLDIILGVQATSTLEDVMDGRATLQQAVLGIEPNLWLVPAAAGLMELRSANAETRARMIGIFERLPWEMDLVIMDVGAGIQDNVLSLHGPRYESVVVLTPEPTSLTDAYGLIKLIRRRCGVTRAQIIVNQVTDGRQGQETFQKLRQVVARFMDVELEYLGHCERDEKFTQSVMKRKILLDLDQGAPAVACLELLAKRSRAKFLGAAEAMPRPTDGSRLRLSLKPRSDRGEPAHGAPANTAKFWRTLLGEVKA